MKHHPNLLPITGSAWPGVHYGCTTRHGGVSTAEWRSFNLGEHTQDDLDAVAENRRRLAAVLPGAPVWLSQVHGTQVFDADATETARDPSSNERGRITGETKSGHAEGAPPVADAAVTTQANRVLAIMTADCAPVVLADVDGRALGVAHAGWRGLAAGVLAVTLEALMQRLPRAVAWRAWVGPCIGQAAFEVGDDVYQTFTASDPVAAKYFLPGRVVGKWQADLAGLACHQLDILGVQSIECAKLCTFQRTDLLYSYRRSPCTGRMATLAWLNGDRR